MRWRAARWRGLGFASVMAAVVVLLGAAAATGAATGTGAAKAPAMTFDVTPHSVGCYTGQRPVMVLATWRIVHRVTSASISGAVDAQGASIGPVTVPTVRTRRGVIGEMKLHVRCSASTETLTLTAVGPGGTTSSVATVNQNRAD